ncbi:head GIN domain-containing protein [Cochleicola gelatinilyticus]|uniref:Putative auto-transporter adhesin head GIN domain-containing protein n=1 Tax=Cochleicola gelatinilyticus TaxID=1763537 RepID=A0A167EZ93_9FLAO|nr:head GIN domain-containing protein [Cochleicola gelatinilyticus]OAB76032.1 hypothetical protein ULVI_13290 [Cochleicola gelatinilyticus]
MKKLIYIVIAVVLFSCDSDKGLNCFQAAGDIIQQERIVPEFNRIVVFERTTLLVQQGDEYSVVVETGENLMNDVEVSVDNDQLIIRNTNGCNVVRDYGITKVIVTAPNITEIRSSTGQTVESIGTLQFPSLTLLSEDTIEEDAFHIDGDFYLNLDVEDLNITANGLSKFYLSGTANRAKFELFSGDTRVDASNLAVESMYLFHRSTNVMIVNPTRSIRGKIVSIGDVVVKTPRDSLEIVEVEELYRGRLIFE